MFHKIQFEVEKDNWGNTLLILYPMSKLISFYTIPFRVERVEFLFPFFEIYESKLRTNFVSLMENFPKFFIMDFLNTTQLRKVM